MKQTAILVLLALSTARIAAAEQPAHPSQEMYLRYCASCHGKDGKGDGPAAAAFTPKPTDLTMLAKSNGGEFPALKVAASIEGLTMNKAHGSAAMPVWGSLNDQPGSRGKTMDVASLTNYLRSIQQK